MALLEGRDDDAMRYLEKVRELETGPQVLKAGMPAETVTENLGAFLSAVPTAIGG